MTRSTRRFAALAVAFTGLRDLVPLYTVYALLFRAERMSDAAISSLFLIWSITSFLAEVPSGAWADLVSRRLLLSLGSLLTGAGFAVWLLAPSFAGFAVGFVLWGVGAALVSGTWESLVYDALAERGATDRYADIIGGGESAGWLAAVASAALATPLLALGGTELVGWVSVGVMVAHAGMALRLPDPPRTGVDPDELDGSEDGRDVEDAEPAVIHHGGRGPVGEVVDDAVTADRSGVRATASEYLRTLAAGLSEATRHPPVRRIVVLLSVLTGLLAFDEYLPLVAAGAGVADATVPLLMTLTFLTQAVASALAGPAARLPQRWPPRLLAVGALLIAAGAISRHPVGFAAVALGYGVLTCLMTVIGAELQGAITGPARATVTSVVGLGSELVAVVLFAAYAGGSLVLPISILVALNAIPLLGVARGLRGRSAV